MGREGLALAGKGHWRQCLEDCDRLDLDRSPAVGVLFHIHLQILVVGSHQLEGVVVGGAGQADLRKDEVSQGWEVDRDKEEGYSALLQVLDGLSKPRLPALC